MGGNGKRIRRKKKKMGKKGGSLNGGGRKKKIKIILKRGEWGLKKIIKK